MKKNRGLYFAFLRAWRKEKPAYKYDLSPGAALMLRAIIDEVNSKFWPSTPVKIHNRYFYETCNFKNRMAIKRYRDQLMEKGLINWHADAANKNESGFYEITWFPATIEKELNDQLKQIENVTPPCLKLATING